MAHAHGTLSFALTHDLADLSLVAEHLERFCVRHDIGADVFSQLNLALDEIVTHIIAHGNADAGIDRRICINLAHDGANLTARIEDDAAAFDPLDLYLVNTLVDEITYSREHDHNVLTIRKTV